MRESAPKSLSYSTSYLGNMFSLLGQKDNLAVFNLNRVYISKYTPSCLYIESKNPIGNIFCFTAFVKHD